MVNEAIYKLIHRYEDVALGWKLSGAGGGGYLILVSETPIDKALRIVIRRAND
jgi:mevalonate kinase